MCSRYSKSSDEEGREGSKERQGLAELSFMYSPLAVTSRDRTSIMKIVSIQYCHMNDVD